MIIAEQVVGAFNVDDKDLLRLFKCLESVERATDAGSPVLVGKENVLCRDWLRRLIPPSSSTMGKFASLKYVSPFFGNCESGKIM